MRFLTVVEILITQIYESLYTLHHRFLLFSGTSLLYLTQVGDIGCQSLCLINIHNVFIVSYIQ